MPNTQVQLRQATQEDIPMLLRVLQVAYEEYRGQLDPPSGVHRETVDSLRQRLEAGGAVLAIVNGEVAGCVFYQPESSHMYLGRLAVLPPYRRQGTGRALIEYVERLAQALNIWRVELGVRVALPALQATYERLGYRPVRTVSHPGYMQPTYTIMAKDLREQDG